MDFENKKIYEETVMELSILLADESPRNFRKALTQILLEWVEETKDFPHNSTSTVHRIHLLIDFFDKLEEIEKRE
jgi:hypothetical protein